MIKIQIQKLKPTAHLPQAGSEYAAGYDLYACLANPVIRIPPHETVKIGTGLACAIPEGYFGGIFARSGLAAKQGLRPANCVGVVDSDYRGEIIIALHNDLDVMRAISDGDRVAQLVIIPCPAVTFEETDTLPDTQRGDNGFGSTGV